MVVTTDAILAGVKRRAVVPSNQITLDDDDILILIDDVIKMYAVPLIDSCNGEYFVTSEDTTITASVSNIDIPYRAIGRAVRDVLIVDNDTGDERDCPYIEPENAIYYDSYASQFGHYFEGDQLVLVPGVPSTYTGNESVRIKYKLRPSQLVKLNTAAKVSSISSPTIDVESVGNIATSSVVDFISGKSGNRIYSMDKTCTNVSSTTLTFAAADIPSSLAVGDYISIQGTAPVVTMIPDECKPWIENLGARQVLLAIGDDIGADKLIPEITQGRQNLLSLFEPRNEGEPKIILNPNNLARRGRLRNVRYFNTGL